MKNSKTISEWVKNSNQLVHLQEQQAVIGGRFWGGVAGYLLEKAVDWVYDQYKSGRGNQIVDLWDVPIN